jgi:predicted aminopeptidase
VAKLFLIALVLLGLGGCADLSYYWQSVHGHLTLMRAAKPVQQWVDDAQTPTQLREQLLLSQRIRRFATEELALPDNASYQRYADLQRKAVVWNVVAAPAWSLTLETWCFPVTGCVSYRGYFDESEARLQAAQLQQQGLEVFVYGVPAYSTLGWMNWAGGDPLLNTFIHYPEAELARMIFHELAHQVVYVPDDTRFNESFATAVERLGVARWLALHGTEQSRAQASALQERRAAFRTLSQATRASLRALYRSGGSAAPPDAKQLAEKARILQEFRAQYARLRASWSAASTEVNRPTNGYDSWVNSANNAAFGAQAAYDDLVPQFEALYATAACGLDELSGWRRFFAAVRQLSALAPDDRMRSLASPLE